MKPERPTEKATVANPALEAFVAAVGKELVLAQVLIRREGTGFELRHVNDSEVAKESLRTLARSDLRNLAQFTSTGAFRPLKSAPNLQTGWRVSVSNPAELDTALRHLYPGAVADWFAALSSSPPVTHYREFTSRQTGMYRITQMLTDQQAAPVIRACCHPSFCLKQRLWTIEGLAPDAPESKSVIPCLEPCALLLEFARKAVRLEQASEEAEAATEQESETEEVREADFNSPNNPRRIQLRLEKQ